MDSNSTRRALRIATGAVLAVAVAGCGSVGRTGPARLAGTAVTAPATGTADAATQAESRGKLGEALVMRRNAAQSAPNDAALRVALARTYLAMKRPGAAAATFRDAIELGGLNEVTARGWADAQLALGRPEAARRMLAAWQGNNAGDQLAALTTRR